MESTTIAPIGKQVNSGAYKSLLAGLKALILVASWSFLAWKLFTFDQYRVLALQWRLMPLTRSAWLAGVFVLLPLNWYLEALKWKVLTSHIQRIKLHTSVKAVLSGISTGFFTPNRIGELVGRVVFLRPENRKAGVTLCAINSLTQNLVMALCGIPACILFFSYTAGKVQPDIVHFLLITMTGILITGLICFTLPQWSRLLQKSKFYDHIKPFTDCLTGYKPQNLLLITVISFLRYVVFCVQFFFMLQFFGVQLTVLTALLAIPTNYLFVTFTPSLSFSEVAVRSSYAVLIIGALSGQVVNIALAGVCIWAVNFAIPMLAGSVVMLRRK